MPLETDEASLCSFSKVENDPHLGRWHVLQVLCVNSFVGRILQPNKLSF